MMESILLNPTEVRIATLVGLERYENDRNSGVIDRKISKKEASFLDIMGANGEMATGKWLNVYPDFDTRPRRGGWDLIYRGWTIDVKSRPGDNKDLMTPSYMKLGRADIYVLVNGGNPYNIVGWCFEKELIKAENIAKIAVESYCLSFEYLKDPIYLKSIMEKKGQR